MNGEQKELKDEVVRLGVKYGIVTPYTSFLVVEDTPLGGRRPASWRDRAGDRRFGGPRGRAVSAARRLRRLRRRRGSAAAPAGGTRCRRGARRRRQSGGGKDGYGVDHEPRRQGLAERIGLGAAQAEDRPRGRPAGELKDKYFSDSVTLSKHLKQLRDVAGGGGSRARSSRPSATGPSSTASGSTSRARS